MSGTSSGGSSSSGYSGYSPKPPKSIPGCSGASYAGAPSGGFYPSIGAGYPPYTGGWAS